MLVRRLFRTLIWRNEFLTFTPITVRGSHHETFDRKFEDKHRKYRKYKKYGKIGTAVLVSYVIGSKITDSLDRRKKVNKEESSKSQNGGSDAGQERPYLPTFRADEDRKHNDEENPSFTWRQVGSSLTGKIGKKLYEAYAIATTYTDGDARNRLLTSTIAMKENLKNIVKNNMDTERVRTMLANTLDCFNGVTVGIHEYGVGAMSEQFPMLLGALEEIPGILDKYHNYPNVVSIAINILTKSTKQMLNSMQPPQNVTKFLEICNVVFAMYVRWNQGKISSIPQGAEEEAYKDIFELVDLIMSIARWGAGVSGVNDTCAMGLRMLLPLLVSPALLSLPTLATHIYRMIRDLDSYGVDQITSLSIDDFNKLIAALRLGLTAASCSTLCCDVIVMIANKVRKLGDNNPYALSILTLAELLLMLIIKREIPQESISAAGVAIYFLICVKPDLLKDIKRQLIKAFDPKSVPRLEKAFELLTNGVIFDGANHHKIRFLNNFIKFLADIRGILLVK